MARTFGPRVNSRVIINRNAMSELERAVADGIADVLEEARSRAAAMDIPDDPNTPERIAATGQWAVFNGTRKVAGEASKPRTLRARKGVITGVVGFSHPLAHIFERGTAGRYKKSGAYTGAIKASPFLLPSVLSAAEELGPAVGDRIRQHRLSRP